MSESFIVEIAENLAKVTLNTPKKHNALDLGQMQRLAEILGDMSTRDDIRVLVLTGAGDRTFCSGADLTGLTGDFPWWENPLDTVASRLEDLPFATICALNGSVYGGGTDLALACDFRIGQTTAKSFIPPSRFGIHYPLNGLRRAVERIGLGPAKQLYLAGDTFDAQRLYDIGFLDYLVTPEEYQQKVDDLTASLMGMAPLSIRHQKYALNAYARGNIDFTRAQDGVRTCFKSEDYKEGQAALAEKRKPVFQGK